MRSSSTCKAFGFLCISWRALRACKAEAENDWTTDEESLFRVEGLSECCEGILERVQSKRENETYIDT